MANTLRIAFIGRSRTANTFCARHLYWHHPFRFVGMDDEMEAFIRKIKGLPKKRGNYYPWEKRLAFYDAWQKVDPTIWADRAVVLADRLETYGAVTPDCRYLEEAKVLEKAGFIFIRVNYKPKQIHDLKTANPTALTYYEWFAKDTEAYVKARYSINIDMKDLNSRLAARKSLDRIVSELTAERKIS